MEQRLIRSVADTARWVAFARALESERSDALFSDPYARRLAGERGEQIAKHMDVSQHTALRTVLFDSLIHKQLARAPIDMVINLAAGLDSRAYRLKLPRSLHWVEVDFPEIVDMKKAALAGETASCKLTMFALVLAFAVPPAARPLAMLLPLPIGALTMLAVFALIVCNARRDAALAAS